MSVVIRGSVLIKVQGLLKQKQLPGQWGVLYDAGPKEDGFPYIALFQEASSASPLYVLQLKQLKFCDKSYRQNVTHYVLSIKKEKYHFQFSSVADKQDWVQSLCHVSTDLWKQCANAPTMLDQEDSESSLDAMSDNLIYDSSEKVLQYKVSICPTKASEANGLEGNYVLNPSPEALCLLDVVSLKVLQEWPYKQIRKYGYSRLIFRMEVGRRTRTGEGEFEFFTPDGASLIDIVSRYVKQAFEGDSKRTEEELSRLSLKSDLQFHTNRASLDSVYSNPQTPESRVSSERSFSFQMSDDTRKDCPEVNQAPAPPPRNPGLSSKSTPVLVPRSNSPEIEQSPVPPPRNPGLYSKGTPTPAPRSPANLRKKETPKPAPRLKKAFSGETKGLSLDSAAPLEVHLTNQAHIKQSSNCHHPFPTKSYSEESPVSESHEFRMKSYMDNQALDRKRNEWGKKKETKNKKQLENSVKELKEKERKEEGKGERDRKAAVLQMPTKPASEYTEIDIMDYPPQKNYKEPVTDNSTYSSPDTPRTDAWRAHARLESDEIHEEDYSVIKAAFHSQPKTPASVINLSQFSHSHETENKEDDVYNCLRDFESHTAAAFIPENIYGMASGKATLSVQPADQMVAPGWKHETVYHDAYGDMSVPFQE